MKTWGIYKKIIPERFTKSYNLMKVLYTTRRATIFLVSDCNNENKIIKITDKRTGPSVEIELLKKLDHPQIIKFIDTEETTRYCTLVFDYYGKDFYEMSNQYRYMKEDNFKKYFCQMVEIVKYLHSQNIIHVDLKLENFLLDKEGKLLLIDFDLSKELKDKTEILSKRKVGSYGFISPEILKSMTYSKKVDIWCLGIILYVCLIGCYPFEIRKHDSYIRNGIDNENYIFRHLEYNKDIKLSNEAKDLIKSLLKINPDDRPTIEQVIEHPWLIK
jgi:serine/threonine protein kinase